MSRFRTSLVRVGLLWIALVCSGCASFGGPSEAEAAAEASDEQGLYLRLVGELLDDGKPHAALAYLDAIPEEQAREPRVQLLRAEVLRRLKRFADASLLYTNLCETGFAGQAWHGLGLIEAAKGEMSVALEWLGRARDLLPTDARIRNDLGYALMLEGEFEKSGAELATAIELGDTQRAPRNLVLLLLVQGERESAEELALRHLEADSMGPMLERAEALRSRLQVSMGMGGGA